MKGLYAFLFALVLTGSTLEARAADIKIGFVNTAKILTESPQATEANKRLEREFAPREKGLADAQKSLRNLEQKLTKDGDVMAEGQRANLERDIVSQRRDLKRSSDEFRDDLNLRRNEELGKFQKQVIDVINSVAKEEGFDLIVNDGAVLFASGQVDITERVLKRLGAK